MCKVLIFGGTSEGRELAELCAEHKITACVSVATDYGAELLPVSEYVRIRTGKADEKEIEKMIISVGAELVADATHPYAREATKNIAAACNFLNVPLCRIKRADDPVCGDAVYFDDAPSAAAYLDRQIGNALITTGSKELSAFTAVNNFKERLTVRVLNLPSVISGCKALGFPDSRIISGKGPFTLEQNISHIKQCGAKFLVTKDSGTAGGFEEKVRAAQICGAELIVIKRPQETGISLEEARKMLLGRFGLE